MNLKEKHISRKGFIKGIVLCAILTTMFNVTIFASTLSKIIEVYPNYVNIIVNGKTVKTENFLYNGTTYVPLRDVVELLNSKVNWDQNTNTATISNNNDSPINTNSDNNESVFKGYFQNVDYSDPNVFLQSNGQTQVTKDIQKVADGFNNNQDLSTVKEIYKWMSRNLKGVEGEKFGRTSDDIITSKGATGCTDYGLAFVSLARAKGIPTVFVQTARIDWVKQRQQRNSGMITGHILAEVYIDSNNDGTKEWCLVDSTAGRLYLNYDKNNFSYSEGFYVFAKSIEVWDSGAQNEQENHDIMMDIFKDFDLSLYDNPKYQYIELLTGQIRSTYDFDEGPDAPTSSVVIGSSAQLLGEKETVELFDDKYTKDFDKKNLSSFTGSIKQNLESAQRIIVLYSTDIADDIPDYIMNLVPEINNDSEEFIMNTLRDVRRIILIKAKDRTRLYEIIQNLSSDFLDNNY